MTAEAQAAIIGAIVGGAIGIIATTFGVIITFWLEGRRRKLEKRLQNITIVEEWAVKGHKDSLRRIDLYNANLQDVNLGATEDGEWADLSFADIRKANLQHATLIKASFKSARLTKANLSEANLFQADMSRVDLSWSNLTDADLSGAILIEANLEGADLTNANLELANLYQANLKSANVTDVQLAGASTIEEAIMPNGTKHHKKNKLQEK